MKPKDLADWHGVTATIVVPISHLQYPQRLAAELYCSLVRSRGETSNYGGKRGLRGFSAFKSGVPESTYSRFVACRATVRSTFGDPKECREAGMYNMLLYCRLYVQHRCLDSVVRRLGDDQDGIDRV